jgi:dienelactone hydrolase
VVAAALVLGIGAPAPAAPRHPQFGYDKSRPLNLRLGVERDAGPGAVRQALTFDDGKGRKAAYWTHPAGQGPWPVVLFSPGSDGTATSQFPDTESLARKGIASLTVAPPAPLISCRAAADVRAFTNYVIGRRRAVDLLPQLSGAETSRVAAVGFSFGAAVTAALAGVDHRLRGAAIQSGRAHLSAPIAAFCSRRLGPKALRAYRRAYSAIDPVHYVGRARPASLLFQNGTQDPISPPKDVAALVRAASSPKEARRSTPATSSTTRRAPTSTPGSRNGCSESGGSRWTSAPGGRSLPVARRDARGTARTHSGFGAAIRRS